MQKTYPTITSVARAIKVLQKLGCCLQIEVGIVRVYLCRTVLMLGRTLGLSWAHTRKEGHSTALQSTKSTLLLESRFLHA